MANHNIQEAIRLTGKSRKTLYRYMDAGKLSYGIGVDGRRWFDTSELMRVFGALELATQGSVSEKAKPIDTANDTLAEMVKEVRRLTEKVESLEKVINEQRLLPAPDPVTQVVQEASDSVEAVPHQWGDYMAKQRAIAAKVKEEAKEAALNRKMERERNKVN